MKPIFLILLVLIILGCNKNEDCCAIISLDANISLKNISGEDLLDPNTPNSFKKGNIKTFHLINGEEKRAGLDDIIYQDGDSIYRYRTFVNYEGNDEFPITYIDWSETDRDTIKSEIYRSGNMTRVVKFWYNNELMWDGEKDGASEFTIVK